MNRHSLIAAAGGLVVLASCSQEEMTKVSPSQQEPYSINFRAGISTRVNPDLNYIQNPMTFYVTAFKNTHKAGSDGVIPDPLFSDEPFYLMGANLYASTSNQKWPSKEEASQIEFFAYAPSLKEIQDAAITQLDPSASNYNTLVGNYTNAIQFFNLCKDGMDLDPMKQQGNTFDGVTLYKGFKLGRFYVATDISKQVDFITAHISADVPENEEAAKIGTEMRFKHQLSNIELRAFSAHPDYNIEIAGVRLGRPFTGGAIFNFCDAEGSASNPDGGQWGIALNPQRLPVEYIYGAGDEIYRMGVFNNLSGGQIVTTATHTTEAQLLNQQTGLIDNIMGKGGNAMVLPTKNGAWQGEKNPWIAPKYGAQTGSETDPYPNQNPNAWSIDKEGDMYFSILIRVTLKPKFGETSTTQIYPYGNNTNMNVIYLEKEKDSNKILGRLTSKTDAIGANSEIAEFGWASVPVGVNWERGKKYVYTLDFTNGVGIQDPEDPRPGTPIIGDGIKFTVSVEGWDEKSFTPEVPQE